MKLKNPLDEDVSIPAAIAVVASWMFVALAIFVALITLISMLPSIIGITAVFTASITIILKWGTA